MINSFGSDDDNEGFEVSLHSDVFVSFRSSDNGAVVNEAVSLSLSSSLVVRDVDEYRFDGVLFEEWNVYIGEEAVDDAGEGEMSDVRRGVMEMGATLVDERVDVVLFVDMYDEFEVVDDDTDEAYFEESNEDTSGSVFNSSELVRFVTETEEDELVFGSTEENDWIVLLLFVLVLVNVRDLTTGVCPTISFKLVLFIIVSNSRKLDRRRSRDVTFGTAYFVLPPSPDNEDDDDDWDDFEDVADENDVDKPICPYRDENVEIFFAALEFVVDTFAFAGGELDKVVVRRVEVKGSRVVILKVILLGSRNSI